MAVQATSNDDFKAEINVTPLVDVVLVLLIIFMVVTPLLKQEMPIDLPIADHSRSAEDATQVTLSVSIEGRTLLDGEEIPPGELVVRLAAIYAGRPDKTIFLEADRDLSHGRVVEVMDDLREAGVTRIGVITKRDPEAAGATSPWAMPPSSADASLKAARPAGPGADAAPDPAGLASFPRGS